MGDPSNTGAATSQGGQEMPSAPMAASITGVEMPLGQMRGDDQPGFAPVSGEMPRGDMSTFGGLAQMQPAGAGDTAVLTQMPGGGMDAQAAAPPAGLEMRGTFRLELSPGAFGQG